MIINNFKNSGEANGAVNYLLSMHDHEGKLRSVAPKILEGNAEITKQICKEFCSKFSHKTVFGVISFADNEKPTDEQKMKSIEDFKKTFLNGMEGKVNCFFVEHNDKCNCEIHYLINRIDLASGKYYNPFPPGQQTKELMKLFSKTKNHELGYEQVKEKPFKMKLSQNERKCLHKERHGIKNLKDKKSIDSALQDLVKSGDIKNRDELINFLKEEGKEFSRIGDDYISIKVQDGRNIRLKGGIYADTLGKNYKEILAEFKNKKPLSSEEAAKRVSEIMEKRNDFNAKRYGVKKLEQPKKEESRVKSAPPVSTENKPIEQPKAETIVQPGQVQRAAEPPQNKPSSNSPSSYTPSSTAGLSVQSAYDKALAKLQNAKTFAQQAQARIELFRAKQALIDFEQAELERKNRSKIKYD